MDYFYLYTNYYIITKKLTIDVRVKQIQQKTIKVTAL